nr:hypothetical protein Iba_chr14fCG12830 [Ipomoea batatas]
MEDPTQKRSRMQTHNMQIIEQTENLSTTLPKRSSAQMNHHHAFPWLQKSKGSLPILQVREKRKGKMRAIDQLKGGGGLNQSCLMRGTHTTLEKGYSVRGSCILYLRYTSLMAGPRYQADRSTFREGGKRDNRRLTLYSISGFMHI